MNERIIRCEQGSPEWYAARSGRITSCRVADATAQPKRGTNELECRRMLKRKLIAEILSGQSFDTGYQSRAMREGRDAEPYARAAYEIATGVMVSQVGFVCHPTIERAGSSPDGFAGPNVIVEIKAPEVATHIDYLISGTVPEEYRAQCVWHLACNPEAEYLDFVSFDKTGTLPSDKQLLIVRMEADPEKIREMEQDVRQFLYEVNGLLAQLGKLESVSA